MKKPRIIRAMDHIDDDLVAEAVCNSTAVKKFYKKPVCLERFAVIAAVLVIALTGVIYMSRPSGNISSNSIVAIDVNPSLEIEVTPAGAVEEVTALNDDARIVIGDMDFNGVDLEIAVNAIIGSMLLHDYISADKNSILISVDSDDSEHAKELEKSVSADILAFFEGSSINASVITQTFKKDSLSDKNISPAKAALINKIISIGLSHKDGGLYTYDQLASLNVNELKQILESKNVTVEGMTSTGTAGKGEFIGSEAAKTVALTRAGINIDHVLEIKVELDFDDDVNSMIYEVEFITETHEYEYEIDAKSGEILEAETEPIEEDD